MKLAVIVHHTNLYFRRKGRPLLEGRPRICAIHTYKRRMSRTQQKQEAEAKAAAQVEAANDADANAATAAADNVDDC